MKSSRFITSTRSSLWAAAALAFLSPAAAHAQLPASVDSALHTLFASPTYAGDRAAPAQWRDGTHYTTLEPSADVSGGTDIVQYSAADGARQVLVAARLLKPGRSVRWP